MWFRYQSRPTVKAWLNSDPAAPVVIVFDGVFMKNVTYDVNVNNGKLDDAEFGWGYTVRYLNLGTEGAQAIAAAAAKLLATVNANSDPNGELTAKLTAMVDGVAQPPQAFKITQEGLCKIQREVYKDAEQLLAKTEKHAKDKKAKRGGK